MMNLLGVKFLTSSLYEEITGLRVEPSDMIIEDFEVTGENDDILIGASFSVYDKPDIWYTVNQIEKSILFTNNQNNSQMYVKECD